MNPFAGSLVEVAGRLVGEQQARLQNQRPGQRDPLLLAARELAGLVIEAVAEPDDLQHLARLGLGLFARLAMDQARHRGVLQRGEFGQEVMELEDEADAVVAEAGQVLLAHREGVLSLEQHRPGGRRIERADHVQERALAHAAGADERGHLAGLEAEAGAAQDVDLLLAQPVRFVHAARFDERSHRGHSSRSPSTGERRLAFVAGYKVAR